MGTELTLKSTVRSRNLVRRCRKIIIRVPNGFGCIKSSPSEDETATVTDSKPKVAKYYAIETGQVSVFY